MPTHIKSLSRHNISDGSLIWNGGSAQTGLAALPHKNIHTATLIDGNGFDWDYEFCDVEDAQEVLDGLK